MQKDEFWTPERLLPKIKSDYYFSDRQKSEKSDREIPLPQYREKRIVFSKSRVLIDYTIYFPTNDSSKDITKLDLILSEGTKASSNKYPIPFNIPFSELSQPMMSFYKYFRGCIKNRTYVECDFSYIVLFLQEIALTAKKARFSEYIEDINFIWQSYKKIYPISERLICDFIFDLSLLLEERLPFEQISDKLLSTSLLMLPQIYNLFVYDHLFSQNRILKNSEIDFLLSRLYKTTFRNSIAYRSNQKYRFAVDSALYTSIKNGLFNDKSLIEPLLDIKIPTEVVRKKKLFSDLPISENDRKYVKIRYYPLICDENIKSRTEECIRYIDNKVRLELKMKNQLSRVNISELHKVFLDKIISETVAPIKNADYDEIPKDKSQKIDSTKIERKLEIDFEDANLIEENSWENTKALTSGIEIDEESVSFGEKDGVLEEYKEELQTIDNNKSNISCDFWEFASALTETEDEFMQYFCTKGKEKAKEFAFSKGIFFETLVFQCNKKAEESFGDIIFDANFEIFDEYKKELSDIFYLKEV